MRKKTARTITPGTKKKGGKEQAIKHSEFERFWQVVNQ